MRDPDETLERVRKLLAKAEDSATAEAEAELFNAKASQLMARYGIDRAMLSAADSSADEIVQVSIEMEDPYSRDKADLLNSVAFPLRCRTVYYRRVTGKGIASVTVIGFKSDVERVQIMYTSLLLQAVQGLGRVRPDYYYATPGTTAAYRRTWMKGFSRAVVERLQRAEQAAEAEAAATSAGSTSTALVILDRKERVGVAFDQEFGEFKRMAKRKLTGHGYQEGREAGTRANLNTTGITNRRATLTSGGR